MRLELQHISYHLTKVSSAEFGSASILPISWMYIRMMGGEGLQKQVRYLYYLQTGWQMKLIFILKFYTKF